MKTATHSISTHPSGFGLLILAACLLFAPPARAGLTLEMNVIRYHQYGYYFSPYLNTNSTAPSVPFGDYYITSFGYPTNGSSALYHFDSNGFNQTGGGPWGYGDFDGMMHELTNATWSIFVTNSVTTNVYHFTVTANISSNDLPYVNITFPADGSVNVTNQPTFAWHGPTNYNGLVVYYYNSGESLPVTQTSLLSQRVLYQGINNFTAHYDSNSTTAVVSSVPINNASQPISSWVSTAHLQDYSSSQFSVGTPDVSGTSHTLVAHYPFDATSGPVLDAAGDVSGNGYNMSFGASSGSQGGADLSSDSAAGVGAVQFHDGDGGSTGYLGWNNPTPSALLSALAGSFSISCWIKTTQNNFGWDSAPAYYGAGIVSADNGGQANDVVPLALTGNKIGFNTGSDVEDVTLNSSASINDGNYHHIVVTRNQSTGQKIIYIDGVLDSFSSGTTNLLNDPQKLTIGALADAGDPDPNDFNYYNGYDGELDDLQFYSGVLSAGDVANLFANPGSTVANGGGSSGGHKNVAHYAFDDSGNLGQDSSGNGNDMSGPLSWGPMYQFDMDAEAGGGAVQFFGTSALFANGQTLTNLNAVLTGSFTFSAWVKTTVTNGADGNNAFFGATIFWAYNDQGNTNDTIPLAITGSKAAFTTRDHLGNFDTLHSSSSVNDGNYHLITVTRNQANGEKKIYVDGNFETSEIGTTDPLNGNNYNLTIGGYAYCTDGNCTNYYSYNGLLDDVQIYTGVLSGSDVAYLYANPGASVLDTTGQDFNAALNTANLTWTTSGDTDWFVETTNTQDGVSAAQSGSVTNYQTSTLQTTVTGPGTLSFYWQNTSFNNLYLEFDMDGNYQDIIGGFTGWTQDGPFTIPAGQHTLSWTVQANGDNDPTEAGYLDQVSYVAATAPVITLNPFDQTNYPGYSVALLAAATSNASITWQWFKVGSASPIPNATNALFIPTNSGTAGVAGNYYGVASNLVGSANTTTASVSFVSAPLPPDWSHALKSPFAAVDASTFTKDYYLGCAVDSAGDIYAAAQYNGNMNVLTNGNVENILTAPGSSGAALVKHAANGNPLWAVGLTNKQSAGYSYGKAVATAPGNGAYLASTLVGTNWLGTNKFVDAGGSSILLSRFDANGSNVWSKLIGGTNYVYTTYNMMVSDVSGNVTLIGNMSGTVNFGGTNLAAPSGAGFMVQYDANGAVRWAQTIPDYADGLAYGSGLLYVSLLSSAASGVTNASIGSLSNVTDRAWAVACVNAANGQALWLRGVGDQYGAHYGLIDDAPQISVSGSDVFLTGNAYGSSAVFGGLSVSLPDGRGQYFARYDTNGNPQVATGFGSLTTTLWASAANASGVYVSGDFDSYSHFGSKLIAAPVYAQNDLGPNYFTQPFVAKFDRNGNALWARNGVSSDLANFRGIATTSDGVWACGFLKITNSIPAQFGTNYVYSDLQIVGSPIGILTWHQAGMIAKITDGAVVALPVTLLNPQNSGANFTFQFLSTAGYTNTVQYRTNLALGNWQTYSNVTGDGTLKTIPIPLSVFNPSKQGFVRVSTQ